MDITFKTEGGTFNYRACAVIINDGKILAMKDGRSPYYYLPGGRVALHETAEAAVLRELREELSIDEAKIIRPLWFNQAFFTEDVNGERYHELCVYFLIDISHTDILDKGDIFQLEEGKLINSYEWLKFEHLKKEYFYPKFIKDKIYNLPDDFTIQEEYE